MMTLQAGRRGILFVISAPSGTGKSSLARGVLDAVDGLEFSVSYTTRERREGEEQGREYHFVDDARFDEMVAEDAFLEWAAVFARRYGTGTEATERALAEGRDLLLDIDIQGARQIRSRGLEAVYVFVLPPDYGTLESRLRERRSENGEELDRRLSEARQEAEEFRRYDYLVINDDLDRAVEQLRCIVEAERRRRIHRVADAERILATFPTA